MAARIKSSRLTHYLPIAIGAAALLLAGLILVRLTSRPEGTTYHTARVKRGDLVLTVSATGTIEPEEVVDVGAQVQGMIKEFGRDERSGSKPIDYGSQVEVGTVLAQIDDSMYKARGDKTSAVVEQSKAQQAQAKADLERAQADLTQMKAKFQLAERDWNRSQAAWATGAISEAEHDTARTNYDVAKANIGVSEAAVSQAKAALLRAEKELNAAEADLREAQRNLDFTTIRSPVKGVIVDRRVNVGQTVVASLNAPSLFLIAKDLTRLQIWASVNEADIGRIHSGQAVRYTIDAFPNETFQGQTSQVRLNATMTQNVVTYTVVVTTDNPDGKLLPYMTANVQFEVDRRNNALLVPNAALRWEPPEDVARAAGWTPPSAMSEQSPANGEAENRGSRGTVWVSEGGKLRPIDIRTGISDGVSTEVVAGDLKEGTDVVVGAAQPGEAGGSGGSPFMPQIGRPSGQQQQPR